MKVLPRGVAPRHGVYQYAMALDEAAGLVYINTATALLVLDAASDTCLRTVPLNLAAPGPIAVDGWTHVVFAVRSEHPRRSALYSATTRYHEWRPGKSSYLVTN